MSHIFKSQYDNYEPAILKHISRIAGPEECFEKRNGIRTQVRAVDFSTNKTDKIDQPSSSLVVYPTFSVTSSMDFDRYVKNLFKDFQRAYLSITNGFVLTTMVGKNFATTTSI